MNKKVIALVALVFAVVVTGFSVSGTYARYIEKGEYSDKARVAKWGIDFSNEKFFTQSADLFKSTYGSYVTSTGDDVIAPGTYGNYNFNITFSGDTKPEVKYELSTEVTVTDNTNKLKFAIVKGGSALTLDEYQTGLGDPVAEFSEGTYSKYNLSAEDLTKILKYLLVGSVEGSAVTKNPGEALATTSNGSYTIYWMWDFNSSEDAADGTNVSDTKLGNGKDTDYTGTAGSAASINISLTAKQLNS